MPEPDATTSEVVRQLTASGYFPDCFNRHSVSADGKTLVGNVQVALVEVLRQDTAFGCGNFYGLHRDVGAELIDFRSHTDAFGKGSLQFVISKATGDCYVDVDKFSPYADVVGFIGHTGEVLSHVFGKWFRRPKQERV